MTETLDMSVADLLREVLDEMALPDVEEKVR
jgi:hypothetical protein